MERIGSGLDTVNFGTAAGSGPADYTTMTNIPADVAALGSGGVVSAINVTTLTAQDSTLSNTVALNADVVPKAVSTAEGAPGSTNDKALPVNHWTVWRVGTDNGNNTYTGLAAPATEREITIVNIGTTGNLTLSHQSASSTAVNRIICPANTDHILTPGQGCRLRYDSTATRWRIITG